MTSDENQIRNLAGRYAHAAMTHDTKAFGALWAVDGVWDDGGTGSLTQGRQEICAEFDKLLSNQDFFIQLFTGGVVEVAGDTATSRWIVREEARLKNGSPYRNVGFYTDELAREDGVWRYAKRTYRMSWSDMSSPVPGDKAKPHA